MIELFQKNTIPVRVISDIFGQLTESEMLSPTGTGSTTISQLSAGTVIERPYIIGGIAEGMTFKSASSGARVEMFPATDSTIGMVAYDNVGAEVLKVLISGSDVGDVIIGNYSGGNGLKWDKSSGVFTVKGVLEVSSIAIPDGVTANSFHVNTTGDAWWGATTIGSATAKILNTGVATFSNITLSGGTFVSTDIIVAEKRINSLWDRYMFVGNNNDGLTPTGGTVTRYLVLSRLLSSGVDCTLNSIRTHVGSGNTIFTTGNGDFEATMSVQLDEIVSQDVIWGIADNGNKTLPVNAALVTHHFAFIVEDGTLYASTGNGSDQTKTEITGITLTDMNVYRIDFTSSTGVTLFYVNDVLKATIDTTISGTTDPSFLFGINAIADTKTMEIINNYMIIHE